MINLISGELYKLFRRKAFYICGILMCILSVLSVVSIKVSSAMVDENQLRMSGLSEEQIASTLSKLTGYTGIRYIPVSFAQTDMCGIVLGIFIAMIVTSEFSNGTIKLYASKGISRMKLYLSKLLVCCFATLIYLVLMAIPGFIVASAFWGVGTVDKTIIAELIKIVLLETLIYFAITSIVVCLCNLFKNSGAAIIASVMFILVFSNVFEVINLIFEKHKINSGKYWIVSMTGEIAHFNIINEEVIRVLIGSVIYIAISTLAGYYVFRKRDIE